MDVLRQPADFDTLAAHAYTADTMPDMALAILLNIQDRIADAQMLVATMATAKEPGYLAHAAGQLNALQELWDDIEQRRQEACKL
jgi:uncharacterized membrane protein YebE (DUF533 family)